MEVVIVIVIIRMVSLHQPSLLKKGHPHFLKGAALTP